MKNLLLSLLILVAPLANAATIQWYHQQTGLAPADGQTLVAENASSNGYGAFKLSSLKAYINAGVSNTVYNVTFSTNTYTTNLFSSNAFFTNVFVSNAYITNLYSSNAFFTNVTVLNATLVQVTSTTNISVFNISQFINSVSNFFDYVFITNNIQVKGNATLTTVIVTNGIGFITNSWAGPTNPVPMHLADQNYDSFTACSITGITSKSNYVSESVLLCLRNLSATNWQVTIAPSITTGDGARAYWVTNGSGIKLSMRYSPVPIGTTETNLIARALW